MKSPYLPVINADPTQQVAIIQRGYCWRKLDRFESAIDDYSAAIRHAPENIRAYNNRAYCFAKLDRFLAAIDDYSVVISLDPTNSHAYHNRGVSYDKVGSYDKAIADFTKVLELDSISPEDVQSNRSEMIASGLNAAKSNLMQHYAVAGDIKSPSSSSKR